MKLKAGDNISREDILSGFNANEVGHPFRKEQSQIEILSFNPSSCCSVQRTSQRISSTASWRKEQFKEFAYSRTRYYGHVATW